VGLSTLEEFYGLTDLLMDPDHGLYKSIGVHEVSTFNFKKILSWNRHVEFFKTNIFVF
jgi:hypothetical protein